MQTNDLTANLLIISSLIVLGVMLAVLCVRRLRTDAKATVARLANEIRVSHRKARRAQITPISGESVFD